MAAGSGAASGQSRGSAAVLESSMDRRFQGVTNTMESIQGLSTWCIENKKHHSIIVRHWIKWLRKCEYQSRAQPAAAQPAERELRRSYQLFTSLDQFTLKR